MKKYFGKIDLTWKKLILLAILAGVYTGVMAMLPIARDTSFSDLAVSFEVWILFGIFIIMNSKSATDSALKCFIFFLISQPLIYLVQDLINHSRLFVTYYRFWVGWTIACIPMGFFGYYMKKDKWWGIIILTPILLFLAFQYSGYLSETMFSFPRHLLTTLFCIVTLIGYPLVIFNNEKIKKIQLIISIIILLGATALCIIKPPVYSTDVLLSGDKYSFDDTYKAYLKEDKYGELSIKYDEGIECWFVHAEFKRAGKTQFVLESPNGEKTAFDLTIRRNKYDIKEKK